MRWRRRHRPGSGRLGQPLARPGQRPGPSIADLLWCIDWLPALERLALTTPGALQRDQHEPLSIRELKAMRDGEGLGWGPLTLASQSSVWTSSGRTSDNPAPRSATAMSGRQPTSPVPAGQLVAASPGGDGALIRAAQADPAAFALLYERYVDAIYRYCVARVGSPVDAEDAASQTFARAFGALSRFRPRPELVGDGVRSWLFTIAHNVVVSGYRDHRPTSPLIDAEGLVDPDPPPEEQAIAAEHRAALRASIARLPDDQRRVVELRLAGLSGPEIATVLGRSHGAIKMLQFRAIDRLRELLTDRLGAGPATEAPHDQR